MVEKSYTNLSLSPFLDVDKKDLTRICYILITLGIGYIVALLLLLLLSDKEPEIVLMYLSASFASFLALLWFVRGGSYKPPFGTGGELNAFYTIRKNTVSIKNEDEELDKTTIEKVIKI